MEKNRQLGDVLTVVEKLLLLTCQKMDRFLESSLIYPTWCVKAIWNILLVLQGTPEGVGLVPLKTHISAYFAFLRSRRTFYEDLLKLKL